MNITGIQSWGEKPQLQNLFKVVYFLSLAKNHWSRGSAPKILLKHALKDAFFDVF